MKYAEQGSILKVSGINVPVIVVSKNFFNQAGQAIVCPIYKNVDEGPLHIEIESPMVSGYVLCEQVKHLDLSSRKTTKIADIGFFDLMNISDAIMGIFDYQ